MRGAVLIVYMLGAFGAMLTIHNEQCPLYGPSALRTLFFGASWPAGIIVRLGVFAANPEEAFKPWVCL